ncbi:MAG: Fic family protein [Firmicutes bacterium]|nr:Fic family protein [Bacillota bacterium]
MEELYKILSSNDGKGFTPEVVREFICLMFDGYKKRKKDGKIYSGAKDIPCALITMYWSFAEKTDLNEIYNKFKRKYIINENNLEDVHDRKERVGLGEVYDFLNSFDDNHWNNIYIILKIHQILYSKVDFPEFGGKFRTENCFISSSDVSTTPYHLISAEISQMYKTFDELLRWGKDIKENKKISELIPYINSVIELKCKLIRIHPFKDGNGRSCRAMVNLLFKQVDLPPVYIQTKEKTEYIKAMDNAIRLNNYDSIQGFYYYKLCDSIVELNYDNSLGELSDSKKTKK